MATTSMNFTLSSTLLGNLTTGGAGNGAYVFAFAFDGNGNLLRSSTLVNDGAESAKSLTLAKNGTVAGGNVVVVTQQVGKGNTSTLPTEVKTIGDVVNTDKATQLNYRYDAIEFTLSNSGSDVADLTNIVQFGAPIRLSVAYSDGTTATRGYAVSGQQIVNDLTALSPPGTQNYPWAAGGPLTGQRETLGLANNVSPNPLNVPSDWKSYVAGFSKIASKAYLSAYFNDTGTLSLYSVAYDSNKKVFWLNPVDLGSGVPTTKDSIKVSFDALTQNIYTQEGPLSVYTKQNGKLVQTFSTFTPNNAWGQITRSLVAGFDAGMWGGSANSLNPLVSGTIDLNQTWNWSAPYTYQAITAPSGTQHFGYTNSIGMGTGKVGDPNRKMYYDPFAAEFVKYSNAYGYSYSDLLSEGGGVNPAISLFDSGTNSDVSAINVKLFDLNETPTGYTAPSFAYVPPTGSTYKPADTRSTDKFLFDFSLGTYIPAPGVPVTFRFYAPGDSQAKNDFVSFTLPKGTKQGKDYEQSFTLSGSPGHWKLTANGYSGSPGFLLITGVPVTSNGSTGWYQMTIGSGSLAKTYNMYVQSSASSPTDHITSAVVDGGALAQQIPNQPNQVKFSFDPSGNITYSPFLFTPPTTQVGTSGDDTLKSGAGADVLMGNAGADKMSGGAGDDIYFVDDAGDRVIEAAGGGSDRVFASASWSMASHQEIETLRADGVGAISGVTLGGNEFDNRLIGGSGNDVLKGGGGNDRLEGNAGADTLSGGIGNDTYYVDDAGDRVNESVGNGIDRVLASASWTMAAHQEIEFLRADGAGALSGVALGGNELANCLIGGGGSDMLVGGGGNDSFRFDTALGPDDVDTIADFGTGDSIQLDHTVFAGLSLGQLSASAFAQDIATGAGPQIVYDHLSGALFYDSNGAAAGGATQFASLSGAPALHASDFKVI